MKRSGTIIVLVLIFLLFAGAIYWVYQKNQEDPTTYETQTPVITNIINKTVATGNIIPKKEIEIKPNISGIIDTIFVKPGNIVHAGDLIAKLKVVPNVNNLAESRNRIKSTKINLDNQKKVYRREKSLFDKGVISANEFDNAQMDYNQAKQNYESAKETYEIIKTGSSRGLGNTTNTNIRATITGMVLDVPVKSGNQVIQANNFNDGTTIATLANVNKMIFDGKIDESEVGKIKVGLPLKITIGAMPDKKFDATLYYISPKADSDEETTGSGAVQFEIKGRLKNKDSTFIRAGLSANAAIILDQVDSVLAIKESLVQFDKDTKKPYVEIKTGHKKFKRQDVKLGLSNGIMVQVKSGLSKGDKIKVWNPIVPAKKH